MIDHNIGDLEFGRWLEQQREDGNASRSTIGDVARKLTDKDLRALNVAARLWLNAVGIDALPYGKEQYQASVDTIYGWKGNDKGKQR